MSLLINNSFQTQLRPELRYYQSSPSLFSCMVWLSFFGGGERKENQSTLLLSWYPRLSRLITTKRRSCFSTITTRHKFRGTLTGLSVLLIARSFVTHSFIHCFQPKTFDVSVVLCLIAPFKLPAPQSTFFQVFAHHTCLFSMFQL